MKIKYGNGTGRPMKRSNTAIAPRRVVSTDDNNKNSFFRLTLFFRFHFKSSVEFWNRIDVGDDFEDLNKNIQFMKTQLVNQSIDSCLVQSSWKKTLVQRRNFIRDHSTKEVLEEYPGYHHAILVSYSTSFHSMLMVLKNIVTILLCVIYSLTDFRRNLLYLRG